MRHYLAVQRFNCDRWDYSVEVNGVMYPVGYCIGHPNLETPGMIRALGGADSAGYKYFCDFVSKHIGNFHGNGHETKEDACRCYRKYLLDTRLTLNVKTKYTGICMECHTRTESAARVDRTVYRLCPDHNARIYVERHMPTVFERWES